MRLFSAVQPELQKGLKRGVCRQLTWRLCRAKAAKEASALGWGRRFLGFRFTLCSFQGFACRLCSGSPPLLFSLQLCLPLLLLSLQLCLLLLLLCFRLGCFLLLPVTGQESQACSVSEIASCMSMLLCGHFLACTECTQYPVSIIPVGGYHTRNAKCKTVRRVT